jgi:hypothetical protein
MSCLAGKKMSFLQRFYVTSALTLFFCITAAASLHAEADVVLQGELSGWGSVTDSDPDSQEFGMRYLPGLKLNYPVDNLFTVDGELTLNLYRNEQKLSGSEANTSHDEKAHRFWVRIYTERFESRLGLQEISFGPGRILRSLRWFDQKDSRDPTNFTNGVNALLFRYYLENNANIWGWGLYGNEDPMGISSLTPRDDIPEFGARSQFSIGGGEIGISFHHRQIDLEASTNGTVTKPDYLKENRIGFDVTWDLELGFWLEYSRLELESNLFIPVIQQFTTVGVDYTFNIGNGLGAVAEYQLIQLDSDEITLDEDTFGTLAVSLQYPLTLLDQIELMAFAGYHTGTNSLRAGWKRTYDAVMIDAALFQTAVDSSVTSAATAFSSGTPAADETGIRLTVQYNH